MKNKSWLVVLLIMMLTLSACGGGTSTAAPAPTAGSGSAATTASTPASTTAVAKDRITLEFWYSLSGDSGDAVEELVKQYNASQSGITVDAIYQGSYADAMAKIDTAIAGDSVPNVAQIGAAPLLGDSDAILPITDFTKTDTSFQLDQIIPAFLDYNTAGGTLWSMPFNNSMPVLYYNKDLFTSAGLDPTAPPKNLDELLADAQKLTLDPDKTGSPSQWGLNFRDDDQWYLSTLFLENGAQIVSADESQVLYNSPEAVAMLQLWQDWVLKYKVMPVNQHSEAQSDFLAGKLAMFIGSSALINTLENGASFNLGTGVFPAVGTVNKDPIGGGSLVIFNNKDTKYAQASWDFVKFMVSKDSQIYLATHTGYLPIYKDAMNWTEISAMTDKDPNRLPAIKELNFAVSIPEFSALGESDAALRAAIQKVELKAATAQQALDDAVKSVNQSIGRLN